MEEEWVSDSRGNKCSVQYFGSREAAQKALDSLVDCDNCTNCSRCARCADCSRCWVCERCSRCASCSGCSNIANLDDKKNLKGDPTSEWTGAPAIPFIENIHAKIYEAVSQPKSLKMGNWHTCDTTHCRAGWVVHLAGEAGYALQKFHNTPLAAQLIYEASGYKINPCRFYDDNEAAMADIKKLAGVE